MRKIIAALTLVVGTVMPLVLASGYPAQAASRMQIYKVYYNPPGSDLPVTNYKLNEEYVSLHNTSGSRITMTGWTLRDTAGHVYRFGTFTIRPHAYVRIHTGSGSNTRTDRYWRSGYYIWNNTGDTATVRNRSGSLVDRCTYSGGGAYKLC